VVTEAPGRTDLRIDGARLVQRLADLAAIGAIDGTQGCCRLALTDEDRAGRDLVVGWMRDLGLTVGIDGLGNVVGVLGADSAAGAVMIGSHIDTVATGGRYDGNLGVLAGLEVIETLVDAGVTTDRPLAVAFFTDEEGARFPPDMLGSLVYAGGMALEQAHDLAGIDGTTVRGELERIGYLGPLPCPGAVPHAYVELHIEQGPVLEAEGVDIGVVTGVQGISWQELRLAGQSNHAGTTPIALRRDAGLVAAQIAVEVRRLVDAAGGAQVGTVGRITLHPGLVNVVAGSAELTVDLRNTDDDVLTRAEAELLEFAGEAALAEGVELTTRSLARFEPVSFDPVVVDLVEAIATEQGHTTKRMPSGAGHDAQMLARVCPAGMIFVPSVKGISHNPAEHTDPADLAAGADVLLHTVLCLTEQPA
jgi:N-carbamoyl-L-amino-acid hydrolase